MAQIADRDALDALAWFWDGCNHERFGAHDDDFAAAVRRSLCLPRPSGEKRLVARP